MSKIFLLFALFIFSAFFTSGQDAQPMPTPKPPPPTLNKILDEAANQTVKYRETFRDLLATETKSFESYEKDGSIDESSEVESNFFVYQSSKDGKTSSELRNIVKVDGQLVPDSQARADRFLGELQKAKTVDTELEKIEKESSRYDKTISVTGITIIEAVSLSDNLRPFFDFKLAGTESYRGRDVYVIEYRQTKNTPLIGIGQKNLITNETTVGIQLDLPGSLKKAEKYLQGKLWIDAETFQLIREESEVAVRTPAPLVAQRTVFEYVPSQFEIYVPKRITFTDYSFKKGSDKNSFTTAKASQIIFNYSEFKKTDVEIEILDDDSN